MTERTSGNQNGAPRRRSGRGAQDERRAPARRFPGPDGWWLIPEGAAVHVRERVAVIADVHLGYEWARGTKGDSLPAHSLDETLAKLDGLLSSDRVDRLVVAGDLVESPAPCRRTAEDTRRLREWLEARGVALIGLKGNHDERHWTARVDTLEVAGWTIGHGHRPLNGPRTISGHLHPVLRASGVTAPCFVVGPRRIVLPAFSRNAAGWNLAAAALPAEWTGEPLQCVASTGDEVLDFGPLDTLAARLGSRAVAAGPVTV